MMLCGSHVNKDSLLRKGPHAHFSCNHSLVQCFGDISFHEVTDQCNRVKQFSFKCFVTCTTCPHCNLSALVTYVMLGSE